MDSDLPLPSPPRNNTVRDTRTTTASNARKRKPSFTPRAHQLSLERLSGIPSSDPPLFSSDDFQSSALENYYYTPSRAHDCPAPQQQGGESRPQQHQQQQSRKRRYRGTWWGEHLHAKKKRTEFRDKRNFDSGVWLCSEDSTDLPASSDDAALLEGEAGDNLRSCRVQGRQVGDSTTVDGGISRDHSQASLPLPVAYDKNDSRPAARVDRSVESEPHRRARSVIMRCLEDGNDNVDLS